MLKRLSLLAAFALIFGSAMGLGYASPAHADDAAPSESGIQADSGEASILRRGGGGEGGERGRRGGGGERGERGKRGGGECAALMKAVKEACPCDGPAAEGWVDAAEYADCVSAAVDAAEDAPEDCATKLKERAAEAELDENGSACKAKKDCGGKKRGPKDPEDPS